MRTDQGRLATVEASSTTGPVRQGPDDAARGRRQAALASLKVVLSLAIAWAAMTFAQWLFPPRQTLEWIAWELAVLCAVAGPLIYWLLALPLRRAAGALRDGERRYRRHFENVNDVICSLDGNLVITAISPSVRTILGRAPEELVGRRLDQSGMIDANSLPDAVAAARRVLGGQRIESAEFRFLAKDGRTVLGECSGAPCVENGRVIGMVVVTRDITERRRAENDAHATRTMLENLANGITDGVALLSADMKLVWVNRAYAESAGVEPTDLVGQFCYRSQHRRQSPCVPPLDPCPIAEVLRTGKPVVTTHTHLGAAGQPQIVEMSAYPVTDPDGRITQFVHLSRDITQRRQAEEELRQSREKLKAIVENIGIGICLVGSNMRVLEMNHTLRQWFPRVCPEDLPNCFAAFIDPPRTEPCATCPVRSTFQDGQTHEHVTEVPTERGTVSYRLVASPVRDADGKVVAAIEMVEDITERRRLQEQFMRAQKMEAVGQLAGGVAHDFNNILTGIMGFAQLAEQLGPEETEQRGECLEEIRSLADRAAALTSRLLAFGRRQTVEPVVLDLNGVVEGTGKLLRRLIGASIQFQWRPAEALDRVRADPSQIEQVLANLVVNARDAMPHGGRLTIQTRNVPPVTAGQDDRPDELASLHCTVLEVDDTGCGMDPATRARIFEPFFTTKEPGKGTGLGLATVYGIVRQHGGHIAVDSRPGEGTTFRIYLPRVLEPLTGPVGTSSLQPAAGGSETILLVEDEPSVRALVRRVLQERGYRVLPAEGPDQAEELFAARSQAIDLLLTDVVMPGRSGPQLFAGLRLEKPGLKVLYMSGYAAELIGRPGAAGPDAPFLRKPFEPVELLRTVRRVLDRGEANGPGEPRPGRAERSVV